MDPALDAALRAALALLLVWAAWHKARDPGAFRATLADYRVLPPALVPPVAGLVIAAEVGAAAALLLGPRALGPVLTAALLAVYGGAIATNLARGRRHIDCGCGGPPGQPLGWWLVGRNALLTAAALTCTLPTRARPLVWVDALTAAGTVAVLAALWAAILRMRGDAPHLARLREGA